MGVQELTLTKNILIGIEAGASSIAVEIEDDKGKKIGSYTLARGASVSALPAQTIWENIILAINKALEKTGISLENPKNFSFHLFIGAPGMTVDAKREEFIKHGEQNCYKHFRTVELDTDVYLTWRAALKGSAGGVFIVGTGSVGTYFEGAQMTESKNAKHVYSFPYKFGKNRVGGMGFPYDFSSLANMGTKIVCRLTKHVDGRVVAKGLLKQALETVYATFFDSNPEVLISKIHADPKSSPDFFSASPEAYKRVAEVFFKVIAEADEPFTKNLLIEAANEFVEAFNALIMVFEPRKTSQCFIWGGAVPYFWDFLPSYVQSHLTRELAMTPAKAAIEELSRLIVKEVY